MVPSNFNVLVKVGLCSNCSQKLDECLLDYARKMLCFLEDIGETCAHHKCFWKNAISFPESMCLLVSTLLPRFVDVYAPINVKDWDLGIGIG